MIYRLILEDDSGKVVKKLMIPKEAAICGCELETAAQEVREAIIAHQAKIELGIVP